MTPRFNPHFFRKRNTSETKKDSWFEKNQGVWTFGATLISGLALIISIWVIIDQKRLSDKNLEIATRQIELAKAQFDSSNNDRAKSEIESRDRFKYQDSINKQQISIAASQLKMQQYLSEIQIENDRPEVVIDSIWIYYGSILFGISNNGNRPLNINTTTLFVIDDDNEKIYCDSARDQAIFTKNKGSILEFKTKAPDSLLKKNRNIIYYITILSEDIILKKKRMFKFGFTIVDGDIKNNENVGYQYFQGNKELGIIEALIKTKNWKLFDDAIKKLGNK